MNICTEDEALAYLQHAFPQHFDPVASQAGINHKLDVYTAQHAHQNQSSPSPENEAAIPEQVTGLRRRYLEAVRKNAIAKKRYEAAARSILQRSSPVASGGPNASASHALFAHLELLRQQKRYEKLGVLGDYLSELDQLDEELLSNTATHKARDHPATFGQYDKDSATNTSSISDLMTKLEIAVVRSAGEAEQEKAQLTAARAKASASTDTDPVQELRALVAVRDELTQWMEQNLALCADGEEAEVQDSAYNEQIPQITPEDVENQYEDYLVARQKLLDAATRPKLPNAATTKTSPMERPNAIRRSGPPLDETFAAEAQHHQRQSDQSMKHIRRYLTDELEREKQESFEGLLRLVDESQLLPQYPVLAKDERFGKIIGSLGGQTRPQADDKITGQIEAWAFAAGAADKTFEATIGAHVARATRALDEVDEMLRDLQILKEHAGG